MKTKLLLSSATLILSLVLSSFGGIDNYVLDPNRVQPLEKGAIIPSVEVRTVAGEIVDLKDHVQGKPAIFIFYRGGWCPYCNTHLSEIQTIDGELEALGVQIYGISPDRPEKLKKTTQDNELSYTLLSDSSASAIRAFGLAFQVDESLVNKYKRTYGIDIEADSGETHHLLPVPAYFLVDSSGVILDSHFDPDYKSRVKSTQVLTQVKTLVECSYTFPNNPPPGPWALCPGAFFCTFISVGSGCRAEDLPR